MDLAKNGKRGIKGEYLIIITTVFWSLGGILIKLLPNVNALAINGIRSFIALMVLFIYYRKFPKINGWSLLCAATFSFVNVAYVLANKFTTAANAIVLQDTAPIYVLIMSSISKRKLPKLSEVLTMLVALFGIVLVFLDELSVGNMLGNVLALLAGVAFAGVFFLNNNKKSVPEDNAMIAFMINSLIGIPFYIKMTDFGWNTALPLLGLGIFQFGLPYIFFASGIKKCNATSASIISLLEAVLNPLWVFLITKEVPGVTGLIGCAVVIIAIAVHTILSGRNKPTEKEQQAEEENGNASKICQESAKESAEKSQDEIQGK